MAQSKSKPKSEINALHLIWLSLSYSTKKKKVILQKSKDDTPNRLVAVPTEKETWKNKNLFWIILS